MDIRNITKKYNNSIGDAIVKKRLPYFRILKKSSTFQVGLGYKQKRFAYDDINSSTARRICDNKSFTKYFLEQLNIPVPKGVRVHNIQAIAENFNRLSKPVVVKPVSEMWGKGVTTNIMTLNEAKRAYKIATQYKGKYVIMEEHVAGDDHRILYIGGKFIAGLKRSPPYIIGNGKDTIEAIIKKENKKRKKSDKIVKEILVDSAVLNFLKKQKYSLKRKPRKGEVVKIRMTGNISSGGISENITSKVHPSIIKLGEEIISYLDLEIGGIDVLTTDITKPLEKTGGRISEINHNPDIGMHTSPYIGKPVYTTRIFIDYLFPRIDDAWITIRKGNKKIHTQEELNSHLKDIPRMIVQIYKANGKKTIIHKPNKPLFNYLLSNTTYSVKL